MKEYEDEVRLKQRTDLGARGAEGNNRRLRQQLRPNSKQTINLPGRCRAPQYSAQRHQTEYQG